METSEYNLSFSSSRHNIFKSDAHKNLKLWVCIANPLKLPQHLYDFSRESIY